MNVEKVLAYIARSRDIEGLRRIATKAKERRSHLLAAARKRKRKTDWEKVMALNLKQGDMVFLHVSPKKMAMPHYDFLWARPLTVVKVKPKKKEVIVRPPRMNMTYALSPRACILLGMSREPTPEALAESLR